MVIHIYVEGRYPEQIYLFQEYIRSKSKYDFQITLDSTRCDIYLLIDVVNSYKILRGDYKKTFKVLIRYEPQIVLPENYLRYKISKFNLLIDIGKSSVNSLNYIYWPQDFTKIDNFESRSKKIVLINSNLLNLRSGEHYSLRRLAAKHFKELDLYGHMWNNPIKVKLKSRLIELYRCILVPCWPNVSSLRHYFSYFDNYLGVVKNKKRVLSQYQFCLVIENSSEYVSEKFFDAVTSGCIPIYVGPELSSYNIPDHLYFQAKPNLKSIKNKFKQAREVDYDTWLGEMNKWLAQPETYRNWSQNEFYSKVEDYVWDGYQK